MKNNWLTIPDAAERLGVSVRTVQRKVKDGELKAQRRGHRILVEIKPPEESVSQNIIKFLEQQLEDLRETNRYLRQQIAEKDKQISELHILMGSRALPSPAQETRHWWKPWQR